MKRKTLGIWNIEKLKLDDKARPQWLTSVILATLEAEIRRSTVSGQPRQKVNENPISTNSWAQ
jgi:hypothetical protein